jgi:fluoride ion exporter CrcB/FEX
VLLAAGDTLDLATLGFLALAASGAAVGSVARDELVRHLRERWQRADLGILVANLIACALAGAASVLVAGWHTFVVLGLAGGLSTWSSLAIEVAGAVRSREWGRVALHVPGALAVALGVFAGARMLSGGVA